MKALKGHLSTWNSKHSWTNHAMITLSSEIKQEYNRKRMSTEYIKTMISYGRNVVKCVKFMIPPLSSYIRHPWSVTVHVWSEHNVPPDLSHKRIEPQCPWKWLTIWLCSQIPKGYYEHLFSPFLRIQILCSEIKTQN